MIGLESFIKNDSESDNRYSCYNLNTSIRIFNYLIPDETIEEVYIFVANNIELTLIMNHITHYIDWLSDCEAVLRPYYEEKLGKEVYDTWYDDIEVYRVDITFNNEHDYGATIYCGDKIFLDHALEFEFDNRNISDIRLNG